ncbi:hypothetical protein JCM4814A_61450 [Streptomyces phaeofaciens JCM 4814]|uniref:Uncharacterized protein n=1 Tax=Streptomyces phaeofaciens TaxID=68254 RepID=A0A918HPS6_9ACTN|nr:hypothetical protein GCM10010226_76240 [Streptomyces phaeofaciens]
MGGDRPEEEFHRVPVVAGAAAAEQGEGAGIVEEVEQLHGSVFLRGWEERTRKTPKAAPRAAFAKSCVRAVSGPPDERSTTSSGSNARTCDAPYPTRT